MEAFIDNCNLHSISYRIIWRGECEEYRATVLSPRMDKLQYLLNKPHASFDVKVDGENIIKDGMIFNDRSFEVNPDGSVTITDKFVGDFSLSTEDGKDDEISTNTTKGASNGNTFWKGYIDVTYTVSGVYVHFTSVSGRWTQQRGSAVLSDRKVEYAITNMHLADYRDTRYPSGNEFYYSTGFPRIQYGHGTDIGANSRARYSYVGNGPGGVLEVNAHVQFAELY